MKVGNSSWTRLGLRGRLFLAFGIVAGLTVLASGSAIISFDRIGRALLIVTDDSLPDISRKATVARAESDVGAAGPSLLAATDAAGREEASALLSASRESLRRSIDSLKAADADKIHPTSDRMLENLDRLAKSVVNRQEIAARRVAQVAGLRAAQQKLAEKLTPMADDAAFNLSLELQGISDKLNDAAAVKKTLSDIADGDVPGLPAILELRADSNLLLGIMV